MRRVSHVLIVTAALCALYFGPNSFLDDAVSAQRQRQRQKRLPTASSPARIDYSKFLHSTKKHQGACQSCHKIPSPNWQKIREYPDVIDYPDHSACVSCHRPQFFKGPKPPICSVCHSRVSPRDDQRNAFRNPEGQRQFQIEFPHDKHQDVIARNLRRTKPVAGVPQFIRASFSARAA